ncbi:transglutaminase-like cysteine peptidase [Bermanella marisrubri]|nr:transglutaminase-like cysteine peptidase [Bermanella marisrubri]
MTSLTCIAMLLVGVCLAQSVSQLIDKKLIEYASDRYGNSVVKKLHTWGETVVAQQPNSEQQKLQVLNVFFNEQLRFRDDIDIWKQEDYWATPLEAFAQGAADCEDYVIAKYFSLVQAGIAEEKLRIMYVKALELNQAHMVLAYYATPRSQPLILDNLIDQIKPAGKRRDLSPVYSFNASGLWLERMRGNSIKVGNPNRLNRWTDLLVRMKSQGLEAWFKPPQLGN